MLNRRKALIGYTVYTIGKPVVKRKLKQKAPGRRSGAIAAASAAVAATAGGLLFWRSRHKGEGLPSAPSPE